MWWGDHHHQKMAGKGRVYWMSWPNSWMDSRGCNERAKARARVRVRSDDAVTATTTPYYTSSPSSSHPLPIPPPLQ